jgi:putative transposase
MDEAAHQVDLRSGRYSQPWGLYLITKCAVRPVSFRAAQKQDIVSALLYARQQAWMKLHAFVVMSDHWHALLSLNSDKPLSRLVGDLARRSRFNWQGTTNDYQWQSGFHDHKVRSGESVVDIVRYIENNPVRKQLVAMPAEWTWSSAAPQFHEQLDRNFLGHERWSK